MITHIRQTSSTFVLITLSAFAATTTTSSRAADVMTNNEGFLVSTVIAKIENVDLKNREVMLSDPNNAIRVIALSDDVKRLDEIKPGDYVVTEYYLSSATDVHKASADELVDTFAETATSERAPANQPPGKATVKTISVTATVEGLNSNLQTLDIITPVGRHYTVGLTEPSILQELRLGDKVRVTCTEAIVHTLVKATPEQITAVKSAQSKKAASAKPMR